MAEATTTYDVVISHPPAASGRAKELAEACRASGLEAAIDSELLAQGDTADPLRDALAESRGLLLVLPPTGLTTWMAMEVGAARAWSKPIFAVLTDPASTHLPADLSDLNVYPPGRIDDIIRALKRSGEPLSDEDREILVRLYIDIGVAADQLALDWNHLDELVKRYRTVTGTAVSGEQLLTELLRMRKQGRLPKARAIDRPRRSGPP